MTPTKPNVTELRALGWSVAVHNDYRLNGVAMTFWLWTHPSGRYVKGEGATDADALAQCMEAVSRLPAGDTGMDTFIANLARQHLPEEMTAGEHIDADYEGAYTEIVKSARALKTPSRESGEVMLDAPGGAEGVCK